MFKKLQRWLNRLKFREGRILSRFVARDVRRDIRIISVARLDEGVIVGCVRTTNLLYASAGLVPQPEFEPPRELHIKELWKWTGKSWGGLADGATLLGESSKKRED